MDKHLKLFNISSNRISMEFIVLNCYLHVRATKIYLSILSIITGEHVQNGDHSDAHISTLSHSSKEVCIFSI